MTPKDALFMTLVFLKHYQTWEKHAVDFSLNAQILEKIIIRLINFVSPALYEAFVTMPSMKTLQDQGYTFAHYLYANGKHNLYGLKIAASADLMIFRNRHDIYAVH
ncbi:hypothetical protein H257_07218 [Aphanomyces astaci]|uniref:DDE Tnp4 domain-containing protein n=1 Tax=Aphanomyces astaci TaxID=112090 RepID=W4GL02_APHAT|nr:hypothetical protein H257_07218 [Aphanomyces astaci]ETV80036.1 hypothetical protein H257_07218 [Aphanomyces astaci]|eukprot:XP_009830972.1 hypothetical protein H257_07218 [Aphanomyces astaci]